MIEREDLAISLLRERILAATAIVTTKHLASSNDLITLDLYKAAIDFLIVQFEV